jgi:cyclopropane fatty-acyl-phospholipid synthase-like methyltransferase
MKKFIKKIPVLGNIAHKIKRGIDRRKFESTEKYWIERYQNGGNSGQGSYNEFAEHKGEVINTFVDDNAIETVLELGCGDGNQLSYYNFKSYTGYEVSPPAIELCKTKFQNDPAKRFFHLSEFKPTKVDLAISVDVLYCLVENETYEDHLQKLFTPETKYVLVFSSNHDKNDARFAHIKHRKFTDWVEKNRPDFEMFLFVKNKFSDLKNVSVADFYFFKRRS